MKFVVKYAALIGLGILGIFHRTPMDKLTPLMECSYFVVEYSLLTILFVYLAKLSNNFRDIIFFRVLSTYFGLKLIYNICAYIPYMNDKLVLWDSEFWGYIFTLIVITILMIIQLTYVTLKKGKTNFLHICSTRINTYFTDNECNILQNFQKRIRRGLRCCTRFR